MLPSFPQKQPCSTFFFSPFFLSLSLDLLLSFFPTKQASQPSTINHQPSSSFCPDQLPFPFVSHCHSLFDAVLFFLSWVCLVLPRPTAALFSLFCVFYDTRSSTSHTLWFLLDKQRNVHIKFFLTEKGERESVCVCVCVCVRVYLGLCLLRVATNSFRFASNCDIYVLAGCWEGCAAMYTMPRNVCWLLMA